MCSSDLEANYIDTLVHAKLRKLRIAPSELCDDGTFLRRVTLDLTGTLPTPAEVKAFVADPAADKRATLVDRLLARREFNEVWVMKWAELLQIRSADQQVIMSQKSAVQYFEWLEDQINRNVPADQMVRTDRKSTRLNSSHT